MLSTYARCARPTCIAVVDPSEHETWTSYISLLGKSLRSTGARVEPAALEDADWVLDDADYVLTLDADSIVLPAYTRTLVEDHGTAGERAHRGGADAVQRFPRHPCAARAPRGRDHGYAVGEGAVIDRPAAVGRVHFARNAVLITG